MFKQGLRLAGVGFAFGLALALAVTRLMSTVLFGVSPTDPATFLTIMVLLALVALFACYVPGDRWTWSSESMSPGKTLIFCFAEDWVSPDFFPSRMRMALR